MKSHTTQKHANELHFTCKKCGKVYEVEMNSLSTMPIWKFESCSKLCAMSNPEKKLLTLVNKP